MLHDMTTGQSDSDIRYNQVRHKRAWLRSSHLGSWPSSTQVNLYICPWLLSQAFGKSLISKKLVKLRSATQAGRPVRQLPG